MARNVYLSLNAADITVREMHEHPITDSAEGVLREIQEKLRAEHHTYLTFGPDADTQVTVSGTPAELIGFARLILDAITEFVADRAEAVLGAAAIPAGDEHRYVFLTAHDMGPEPFTPGWYCEECMAPAPLAEVGA